MAKVTQRMPVNIDPDNLPNVPETWYVKYGTIGLCVILMAVIVIWSRIDANAASRVAIEDRRETQKEAKNAHDKMSDLTAAVRDLTKATEMQTIAIWKLVDETRTQKKAVGPFKDN